MLILSLLSVFVLRAPKGRHPLQKSVSSGSSAQPPKNPFRVLRRQMVEEQILPRDIVDRRVLKAMATVPRHLFVDADVREWSYCDRPLPIGDNQTISQPYIVAYMTQAARITPAANVLEIGTGSGYQAAILGVLAQNVYSVERIPTLAEQARDRLSRLGYTNVHVKIGDGYQGWAAHAPYDAILVTAAPKQIPNALVEQLTMNGRLVIPVGGQDQEIWVLTKTPEGVMAEKAIAVRFVPMLKNS